MNKKITRGLALALALIMCVSLLIGLVASAAEPTTFTKVTDGTLVSGQYVMVANNGKALATLDGTWALSADPTMDGEAMTNGPVVTLTVDGTTVTITDANGKVIAPKSNSNNLSSNGIWNWKYENGTYTFDDGVTDVNDQGVSQTRYLASVGKDSTNRFRAYRNPSAEGDSYGNTYFHLFTLYKVEGDLPEVDQPEKPEEPVIPTTPAEIVDAAYALEAGAALEGTYTLTGKVIAINTEYSEQYKNVTVTIAVEGKEDKPIECYRLQGDEAALVAKNDIITVTGVLKNYNGKIEFDAKCTLDARVPAAVEAPEPFDPTGKTVAEILDAAFALGVGDKFGANCTLTGAVTAIDTPYSEQYGNVSVVIDVEGKELLCYRLIGDEAALVAEGDTITVTGLIKNYNGTIEFDAKCTLDARVPAAPVEPPKEEKTLVIGDKTYSTDNWIYNEATDAAGASKLGMLIYDKNYEGEVVTNGWGGAIVLDKYGKLVKIYDGANVGFWTEAGKSTDPLTFNTSDYSTVAFSELADGEMLIVFPHSGGDPNPRAFALGLRDLNGDKPYCGKIAALTGFEFEAEPVDPPVEPEIPDAGDTAIFFVLTLMTVAMAAVVVLTKKQVR